jgi:hypothetical protein
VMIVDDEPETREAADHCVAGARCRRSGPACPRRPGRDRPLVMYLATESTDSRGIALWRTTGAKLASINASRRSR